MANQVYIIPRRNDLDGMNIQVTDLRPNTSQRNLIYDGAGQSGYEKWSLGTPGITQVLGDAYASGSTNTALTANLVNEDTTGGGLDVNVPNVTAFGLPSYLRERVHVNPGGVDRAMLFAEANNVAAALTAEIELGNALNLAAINVILQGVLLPGADTDLDGAGAASTSFGVIEEILQILQGQVYRTPALTIIETNAGVWLGLIARTVLVVAQVTATTGQVFVAQGVQVARGEPGFRDFRSLLRTGALNISSGEGVLAGLKGAITGMNPNFAYTAGGVTALVPRAMAVDGVTVIPDGGTYPALAVYDHMGGVI